MWSSGQDKSRGTEDRLSRGASLHLGRVKECVPEKLCLGSKERREDCRKERACWKELE